MKRWFSNLNVGYKLAIGFGVAIALMCVITANALSGAASLRAKAHDLSDKALAAEVDLSDFTYSASRMRILQYRVTGYDGKVAKETADQADACAVKAGKALEKYTSRCTDPVDKKNGADLQEVWNEYATNWKEHREQVIKLDGQHAFKLLEATTTSLYLDKLVPQTEKVIAWNQQFGRDTAHNADQVASSISATAMRTGFFAIVFSALFALVVTRSITGPVKILSERLSAICDHCLANLNEGMVAFAAGNLTVAAVPKTQPIPNCSNDELGRMSSVFNELLGKLQSTILSYNSARLSLSATMDQISQSAKSVLSTSESLAASCSQSSTASSEIACGSEKLASSATDAAGIMEELAAQVVGIESSSKAQDNLIGNVVQALVEAEQGINGVASASQSMAAIAQSGNAAVVHTVAAMGRVQNRVNYSASKVQELDEKGRQIGKIVQSIEAIAEQTNLLALNAAIEAARAGEHGRGFAVVADEVRKLAEQAAKATKEIGTLIGGVTGTVAETVSAIEATTLEVSEGAEKSADAGRALEEILAAAQQVATRTGDVAQLTDQAAAAIKTVARSAQENVGASQEMATGADKVVSSISNVAAISQEAAAGAEELSATIHEVRHSADELSTMSKQLEELVAQFKYAEPTPSLRLAA